MKHGWKRLICLGLLLILLTPASLAENYQKLQKGSQGADVQFMQEALKKLGYQLEADGKYGSGTMAVVKKFQKKYKLTADGVAGDKTLTLLYTLTGITPPPTATAKPSSQSVSSGGQYAVVRTSGGSLKLRATPVASSNGVVYAYIPDGTKIEIKKKGAAWCTAVYQGKTGYVMTKYLSFDTITAKPTATKKPTATPKKTAKATATPKRSSGGVLTGYVNTSNGGSLNLRENASDSAKVLCTIPNGTELTISSRGSAWCAVAYNGYAGFVMTKFLYIPVVVTATPQKKTTATPKKKATATPKATASASVYRRILRSGYTGDDVTWAQTRLKTLGYLQEVSGVYDAATIEAVKAFQRQNGLTVDGLAGEKTFTLLAGSAARRASDTPVTYTTLRIDQTGSEVSSMQSALLKLGYPVKVNGNFDVDTHNAVVAFQVRNGLEISGIADGLTRTVIMGGKGKPYSTKVKELSSDAGRMSAPKASAIKLLHWQNDIKPTVKAGQTILIFDPQTNLSWNLVFYSLGRHADSQPATWRDTQIMNRSFGSTSWDIHPVYVKLPSGTWTIATMHNRPHLTGSITNNGFGGHLCVHFLRTMSEAQQNDPNYGVQNQVTLRNAWKALTGETITY